MANTVDTVKNSFIANVNLLVRKLTLLIEINEKFSQEDAKKLIEILKLNIAVLIEDLEKGDASYLKIISDNLENLTALFNNLDDILKYGEYFKEIKESLFSLISVYEALPKLITDPNSIYNNLDKLLAIKTQLDALPDTLEEIREAANKAINASNEIKNLSIAVEEATYGQLPSGNYNAGTGMLTFKIPEGKKGDKGDPGIGINGINGSNGTNGFDGDSAYIVAVKNGYNGTIYEWLEFIKGKDGKDGLPGRDSTIPGPKGEPGTITAGSWPLVFGNMEVDNNGDLYLYYAGSQLSTSDVFINETTGVIEINVS